MPRHCASMGNAIVCGDVHPCCFCGQLASYQCDYILRRPGSRCNRWLCEAHRTNLVPPRNAEKGGGKDACPDHAAECLVALERRKLAHA